jgi:hypothetical protein
MNAFKTLGGSGLEETCSQSPECQTRVEDAIATSNFVASIPGAKGVVHSRKERCFKPTNKGTVDRQFGVQVDAVLQ